MGSNLLKQEDACSMTEWRVWSEKCGTIVIARYEAISSYISHCSLEIASLRSLGRLFMIPVNFVKVKVIGKH